MAKQKPDHDATLTVETTVDEASVSPTSPTEADRAIEQFLYLEALNKQDPIVYYYNGNAAAGESMAHVPLADIRASLWAELEPYMQAGVAESPLFTKVEVANG